MPNTTENPILKIKNLSIYASKKNLLSNINLDIYSNEIISLMGVSGVGKSTLLRSINRLSDMEDGFRVSGDILYSSKSIYKDISLHSLRKSIGMVFQKPCVFPGSIEHNVLFGIRHHLNLTQKNKKYLVESSLQKAHLWEEVKHRLKEKANHLSLGQKQRLCLARVIANDPEILLLDEPTASLDSKSSAIIEDTILELKMEKTIILVTHNEEQGRRLGDRNIYIHRINDTGHLIQTSTQPSLANSG